MTPEHPQRVDVATVTRRLVHLRQILTDLALVPDASPETLEADRMTRYAVERMLTVMVELAIDINTHVAARRLSRTPGDGRESFDLAAEAGVISGSLAMTLRPAVGLRNVLTHEYLHVDGSIVSATIPQAIDGFREYVRQVARFLEREAG